MGSDERWVEKKTTERTVSRLAEIQFQDVTTRFLARQRSAAPSRAPFLAFFARRCTEISRPNANATPDLDSQPAGQCVFIAKKERKKEGLCTRSPPPPPPRHSQPNVR